MFDRIKSLNRRAFVRQGAKSAASVVAGALAAPEALAAALAGEPRERLRFGVVTYQWGRDWNLPTLLRNVQRAGATAVELRVDHAHGVEPAMSEGAREDARLRFDNSPVTLLGFGTNWSFHHDDADRLRREMQGAREHVRLSQALGGSGVKVKPDGVPAGAATDAAVERIARSLDELGRFAADHGQEIRLEVHGEGTQELPTFARILDAVESPAVRACWNCNPEDLAGEGLAHNFGLVADRLGRTVHVHELDSEEYPYAELFDLLVGAGYDGWILMEARSEPTDRVKALVEQKAAFDRLVVQARARAQGS